MCELGLLDQQVAYGLCAMPLRGFICTPLCMSAAPDTSLNDYSFAFQSHLPRRAWGLSNDVTTKVSDWLGNPHQLFVQP